MAKKTDVRQNNLQELRKKTDVLNMTFEKIGLQVVKQSWQLRSNEDDVMVCYLEVMGSLDNIKSEDVHFQTNLYDAEGDIIYTSQKTVAKDEFVGYGTYSMVFLNDDAIYRAVSARVFAGLGFGW